MQLPNDKVTAEARRCLSCAKPGCQAACPVGNNIPQILQLVAQGKFEQATCAIGHPFGEVCGYVCPHERYCFGGCVLGKKGAAVDFGAVERELFAAYPFCWQRQNDVALGSKVAVVGGGVAGITFAAMMYRSGADVTLFEKDRLLSTLRLIPDRLPQEALLRVERQLEGRVNVVSKDVDACFLAKLQSQFDFVFVATGAAKAHTMGIPNEDFCTPYAVFLDERSLFRQQTDLQGKHVAVVGGGNTAMDCARFAAESGAQTTVLYRRARADMPAFPREISDAEQAGVVFRFNVAPVALENGLLTLARTETEGRGKLVVTDETHTEPFDIVVTALGSSFDDGILQGAASVLLGGDAAGGKTVAEAVRDGISCAQKILQNLQHGR